MKRYAAYSTLLLNENDLKLRHLSIIKQSDVRADKVCSRAITPLMMLVEVEERLEAPDHPQSALPQNWSGTEQHRTVTCMLLKSPALAKVYDRRKNLALRRDELRGH
ncbi:hypothetical protein TNCV_1274501 [Trichonephila clavipes]|nr:hypothetical protein TNCV_1274501 [Trichonephila clavipes]